MRIWPRFIGKSNVHGCASGVGLTLLLSGSHWFISTCFQSRWCWQSWSSIRLWESKCISSVMLTPSGHMAQLQSEWSQWQMKPLLCFLKSPTEAPSWWKFRYVCGEKSLNSLSDKWITLSKKTRSEMWLCWRSASATGAESQFFCFYLFSFPSRLGVFSIFFPQHLLY